MKKILNILLICICAFLFTGCNKNYAKMYSITKDIEIVEEIKIEDGKKIIKDYYNKLKEATLYSYEVTEKIDNKKEIEDKQKEHPEISFHTMKSSIVTNTTVDRSDTNDIELMTKRNEKTTIKKDKKVTNEKKIKQSAYYKDNYFYHHDDKEIKENDKTSYDDNKYKYYSPMNYYTLYPNYKVERQFELFLLEINFNNVKIGKDKKDNFIIQELDKDNNPKIRIVFSNDKLIYIGMRKTVSNYIDINYYMNKGKIKYPNLSSDEYKEMKVPLKK